MDSGGNGVPSGDARLVKLDIADAATLFIGKGTGEPVLYKVTTDGQVSEVSRSWVGGDGQPVDESTSLKPSCVWNASRAYVVVTFSESYPPNAVLVRKSNGTVYAASQTALGGLYCPTIYAPFGDMPSPLQADAFGNLYVLKQDGTGRAVYMIDVTDPSRMSEVRVSPEADNVQSFVVNAAGDVFYKASIGTSPSVAVSRFRNAAGRLVNYDNQAANIWVGLDGKLYRQVVVYGTQTTTDLLRIEIGDGVTETKVSTWPFDFRGHAPERSGNTLVWLQGVTVGSTPTAWATSPSIVQLAAMDGVPNVYPLPSSVYRTLSLGPSSIWLVGNDGATLTRWTSSATTPIPVDAGYDIYSLSAIGDDRAVIDALRMADGVKIMASVQADGSMTISDVGASPGVSVFLRIQ